MSYTLTPHDIQAIRNAVEYLDMLKPSILQFAHKSILTDVANRAESAQAPTETRECRHCYGTGISPTFLRDPEGEKGKYLARSKPPAPTEPASKGRKEA